MILVDGDQAATDSDARLTPLRNGPVATVYTAQHNNGMAAVKAYPGPLDRRTLSAIKPELAKLASLSDTAPILAVDAVMPLEGGRHGLRMELCVDSLSSRVRVAGPVSPSEVAELGRDLARALAAAHGAGIRHGGVTPDNVLYRSTGKVVLADFGVALREAFPRPPLYAAEYSAPEMLQDGIADERTDLYGLGAVLYYALTGESPHPRRIGETDADWVMRIRKEPAAGLDIEPSELSTVVGELLAVDAEQRPAGATEVAERLALLAPDDHDLPVIAQLAPPPPAKPRPRPPRSNRPLLIGAATVAVLLLLAGIITVALHSGSDQLASVPMVPPPPAAQTTAAPTAHIDLDPPQDLGDKVVLTWTNDGTLDFDVVVATDDGKAPQVVFAQRNNTYSVPVDPARKYCFLIQGTDSTQVVESQPRSIRGAVCHK
jgi:serine/threonine protein kinase